MFQHTSYRWANGSPLVNFEHWNFPDVVNAFSCHKWNTNIEDQWWGVAKSPANEQLNFYMKQLQPHSGTNDTLCVATLIPALATKAWFLVPCDAKFKARLVCQVEKMENAPSRSLHIYCMGQAFILAKWCIVHVTLEDYDAPTVACLPFKATEVDLKKTSGVIKFQHKLCLLFEQLCEVTDDDWIMNMDDITNTSHVCIMPAPNVECPEKNFQCKDLSCIPTSKHCNNIIDCLHGEDEEDCFGKGCGNSDVNCQTNCTWPKCKCAANYFQCDSGGCVPGGTVCDFEQNCLDGSDELHCNELLCPTSQMKCSDNRACIDEENFFDGVEDCMDASDENIQQTKSCPGFKCKDFSCIPLTWLNDGIPDCLNDEDEKDFMLQRAIGNSEWPCPENTLPCRGSVRRCYQQEHHCIYDTDSYENIYTCRNAGHLATCEDFNCTSMYKCPMSYCISFHRVCNGVIDCQDSSDENNCPIISCPGMFQCKQEDVCIHQQDVCDGKIHCKVSQDDEKYCEDKILEKCSRCFDTRKRLLMSSLLERTHVRKLSLQDNGIEALVSHTLTRHTSLIVMDLAYNLIKTLPSFVFHCFPYLQYIFLNHNHIHSLLSSPFMNIGDLMILDLSFNDLSSLSTSHFEGLGKINMLDLSYNHLMAVDKNFFHIYQVLKELHASDSIICCMIPSQVTCVLRESTSASSCIRRNLFMHPALSYIVLAESFIMLVVNMLSGIMLLNDRRNFLILNLCVSDALFGCYLAILAGSDFYYSHYFSFYVRMWPSSIPCYSAMLTFFVSFQQALISLVLISFHACILIAFPFNKKAYKYLTRALLGTWILVIVQLLVVIYLQQIDEITIVSSNHFCQSPDLAPSITLPFVISFCFIYTFLILGFCVCFIWAIILIKRREEMLTTANQKRQNFKRKMIKKSLYVLLINFLSLLSVVVAECLIMAGFEIDDAVLISITLSIMSLSKICNSWLYTLHKWVSQKVKEANTSVSSNSSHLLISSRHYPND